MSPRTAPHDRRWRTLLASAFGLLLAGPGPSLVHAGTRPGHEGPSLPEGDLHASTLVSVGLDIRSLGAPVGLALDLHLGVTDRLTLGLTHSGAALDRLSSGWGLCPGGPKQACEHPVSGTALDSVYTVLRRGWLDLALRARLYVAQYEPPLKLRVTVGLAAVFRLGAFVLRTDPHVSLGLSNRREGNAHALNVPIHMLVALGTHVALYLRTGVRGLLLGFADQYAIPLGLGLLVYPVPRLCIGAQISLRQILGPQNTYKKRDLLIFAGYRFSLWRR